MNPENFTCQRLNSAAFSKGCQLDKRYTLDCEFDSLASETGISCLGMPLSLYDGIIPRFGPSVTGYGTQVLEQLEKKNIPSLNSAKAIRGVRNKKKFFESMRKASMSTPKTLFPEDFDTDDSLISSLGDFPIIIKHLESARGEGVYLAKCHEQFKKITDCLRNYRKAYYLQPFISDADNSDFRYLLLGNRIIAKMKRRAAQGDFRSNLFQGGAAEKFPTNRHEEELAVGATEITGLKFAAVDFIRAPTGSLLLEVNVSPGFEGLESLTKLDIAGEIINYMNDMVNLKRKY